MTTKTRAQIAQSIQSARKAARLTQLEVADKSDINVNYYAKIERGESMPSLSTLEKILKAIGVHSSKILPF